MPDANTPATVPPAPTFTPGPWRQYQAPIDGGGEANYRSIDAGAGFLEPGQSFGITGFITPADAALIAAAPDLLAALRNLCDAIDSNPAAVYDEVNRSRAAIAKAERQP